MSNLTINHNLFVNSGNNAILIKEAIEMFLKFEII